MLQNIEVTQFVPVDLTTSAVAFGAQNIGTEAVPLKVTPDGIGLQLFFVTPDGIRVLAGPRARGVQTLNGGAIDDKNKPLFEQLITEYFEEFFGKVRLIRDELTNSYRIMLSNGSQFAIEILPDNSYIKGKVENGKTQYAYLTISAVCTGLTTADLTRLADELTPVAAFWNKLGNKLFSGVVDKFDKLVEKKAKELLAKEKEAKKAEVDEKAPVAAIDPVEAQKLRDAEADQDKKRLKELKEKLQTEMFLAFINEEKAGIQAFVNSLEYFEALDSHLDGVYKYASIRGRLLDGNDPIYGTFKAFRDFFNHIVGSLSERSEYAVFTVTGLQKAAKQTNIANEAAKKTKKDPDAVLVRDYNGRRVATNGISNNSEADEVLGKFLHSKRQEIAQKADSMKLSAADLGIIVELCRFDIEGCSTLAELTEVAEKIKADPVYKFYRFATATSQSAAGMFQRQLPLIDRMLDTRASQLEDEVHAQALLSSTAYL